MLLKQESCVVALPGEPKPQSEADKHEISKAFDFGCWNDSLRTDVLTAHLAGFWGGRTL